MGPRAAGHTAVERHGHAGGAGDVWRVEERPIDLARLGHVMRLTAVEFDRLSSVALLLALALLSLLELDDAIDTWENEGGAVATRKE